MEKLTDREVNIMMVIWNSECDPVPTGEILDKIEQAKRNSLQSLQVVLRRLCGKGVLQCEKGRQTNLYHAVISKEDYLKFATENFVNYHFRGSFKLCLQFQLQNMPAASAEIKELLPALQNSPDEEQ